MSPVATLRTRHADAETVAAALGPDNTDEMSMAVESDSDADVGPAPDADAGTDPDADAGTASVASAGTIVTTIERETTGGLAATVDDTVVNLSVATAVVENARPDRSGATNRGSATNPTTNEATNEAATNTTIDETATNTTNNETATSDASTMTTSTRPATPDESTESKDDTPTHDNE